MDDETRQRLFIDILFREYDTLRAEVLARIRTRFELLGFITAIAAFIGSQSGVTTSWRIVIGVLALTFVISVWLWFGGNIKKCAQRLREIEEKINGLAGEQLLRWESGLPRASRFYRFIR